MWEIEQPKQLDAEAEPTPEAIEGAVAVAGSPEELADRIAQEAEGFDAVYLHHVGKDQTYFLDHAPALLARRRSAL